MSAEAWIFLAAALLGWALVVALSLGDVNLAERLRAAHADRDKYATRSARRLQYIRSQNRREHMLLDDLDFACAEAVRLRERLDVLEARGLPDLAEMRAGGAG